MRRSIRSATSSTITATADGGIVVRTDGEQLARRWLRRGQACPDRRARRLVDHRRRCSTTCTRTESRLEQTASSRRSCSEMASASGRQRESVRSGRSPASSPPATCRWSQIDRRSPSSAARTAVTSPARRAQLGRLRVHGGPAGPDPGHRRLMAPAPDRGRAWLRHHRLRAAPRARPRAADISDRPDPHGLLARPARRADRRPWWRQQPAQDQLPARRRPEHVRRDRHGRLASGRWIVVRQRVQRRRPRPARRHRVDHVDDRRGRQQHLPGRRIRSPAADSTRRSSCTGYSTVRRRSGTPIPTLTDVSPTTRAIHVAERGRRRPRPG